MGESEPSVLLPPLSPENLAARQLGRLREVLGTVESGNAFYGPRLARAGVTSRVGSLEEFTQRLPFTTKAELAADQAAFPPFGTNLSFPLPRYTRFCQTSGTSAAPLAILDTTESWEWMLGNWGEIYRAAEIGPGTRLYFAFSFGPFLGFWTAFEAAVKLGCLCLPGGGLSSAARLRALLAYGAEVLCCTPTYAIHLGETAARSGVDLGAGAIRKILVAGEPGGSVPAVREHISRLWAGATVLDHYGLTETGPVALQRLDEPGALHVMEDAYFPEIVHPESGAPVPGGETGELVLTSLGRSACPLLRYRTGDLVARDAAAPGFVLKGGVLGRADDMVVVRGVNLYPAAVDAVVRSVPGAGEYQVVVSQTDALVQVSMAVETDSDEALHHLESALTSAFSLRIPVARAASGSLPRFEMKARRWVRRGSGGKDDVQPER
jgi:phenylacetate-CoA ligase